MKIGLSYNLKTDLISFETANGSNDKTEELDSEETVSIIENALKILGYEVIRLGFGKEFLNRIKNNPVDLVFNIAEGLKGRSREAQVPAILEMLGIPYTFSDPLTLTLALDKPLTKKIVRASGFKTPRFFTLNSFNELDKELRKNRPKFPLFVKLAHEGSSMGISSSSKISNIEELNNRVSYLFKEYDETVLVEEFIKGREFTVGVLGYINPFVLGVMEVKSRMKEEDFIYTLEHKRNWQKMIEYVAPPKDLDSKILRRIEKISLGVYKALDIKDAGRIDLRVNEKGEVFFLEINPLPGLSAKNSDLPIMARKIGISYERLIKYIVDSAIARNRLEYKVLCQEAHLS